ncbi:extracellular solute-binding protein [Aminobacter sp. SR38]|jgi:putative spermidine/putrescine transport system substrate-binding protein|uniref:extracellular solute-binding protein n=1 Tax=Aminobacter sp. SR38 TaxID=2774562 RepID=UPI00177EEE2D|nr:extracellular solute-binding protein [Aminobacter sp. SR38]QOF69510.1 extracellular solute-binding protein [Aminobacter sp. SR38]
MAGMEVNRRELIRLGLLAGAGSIAGSALLRTTDAFAASEVIAAIFPGSWEDAFQKVVSPAFKEAAGSDLVLSPALASDQLGKMMASPTSPPYDALLMSPGQSAIAIENNLIEKVDPSQIPNWGELSDPSFQNEWGPAVTIQLDGLAYNPQKVRAPKGYGDLFSPDFFGRVAFTGFKSNSAVMAWIQTAKAFGGSEQNLDPLWPKLKDYLQHVGAIANDMNHQQSLFQQGEIDVMIASTGNVARLKSLGVPIEFVVPEEGAPATPVNIHLTKGAKDPKAVYAYMDAVISAKVQDALQAAPLNNFPTNKSVALAPDVAKYMTREQLASFVYLDWKNINARRAEWTAKFDEVVRQ